MDAAASSKIDDDFNKLLDNYLKIDTDTFSTRSKQRRSVIKYTKLPDYDFNSNVSWDKGTYFQQPRVRRIITLEDEESKTSRSLKPDTISVQTGRMANSNSKRKIVTISEDDENDFHPRFFKDRKSNSVKTSSRSVATDFKEEKQNSQRSTSRLSTSTKCNKGTKAGTKTTNLYNSKKSNTKEKQSFDTTESNIKMRNLKDKDNVYNNRSTYSPVKINLSKNIVDTDENSKELDMAKTNIRDNRRADSSARRVKTHTGKTSMQSNKNNVKILKQTQNKPITIIHVPFEEKCETRRNEHKNVAPKRIQKTNTVDCGTDMRDFVYFEDVHINTEPLPPTVDRMTGMDEFDCSPVYKSMQSTDAQTELIKATFDSLEIPNVTLTKEHNKYQQSESLPNMKIPSMKTTSDQEDDSFVRKTGSYIISRATLTYTTKQKINIQVVSSSDEAASVPSSSPMSYPMNVISVFKNEIKKNRDAMNTSQFITNHNNEETKDNEDDKEHKCRNEIKSLHYSHASDTYKLMKPSEIISSIKVNSLAQSDFMCEQFQREFNFIDSFFESLQYLENCSLSNKCLSTNKVENLIKNPILYDSDFDIKATEYLELLPKFENGTSLENGQTMATKSLCLLNLLIRDEQRRARNLLYVLKMREDALKDFTKSQILWLENKKKHENTDVSTLKKKQRGALLKLQHECGEMHRMRKALLTLSEKRKDALIKTKKNIELKLKNNVDVEHLIEKKKLKRNGSDRNIVPLKCFDLSSSGCEETLTSRSTSEIAIRNTDIANVTSVSIKSAEKSIQTGDSILETLMTAPTDAAAENFVVVDGGYLNIIFHNLTLPQIFSNGKQYEVNEEALRNIVNSSNQNQLSGNEVVNNLMEQIQKGDIEMTSTPSTARSLVEEFDQYYKSFVEEEIQLNRPEREYKPPVVCEIEDKYVQVSLPKLAPIEPRSYQSASTMTCDSSDDNDDILENLCTYDMVPINKPEYPELEETIPQTGPLPVPVGASYVPEPQTLDSTSWSQINTSPSPLEQCSSRQTFDDNISMSSMVSPVQYDNISMSSMVSPVQYEAEELRRQQLAIEREIKALEQEQCRLLVVREIPDKPPPPYTPPADPRIPKRPRMFLADEKTNEIIYEHINHPASAAIEPTEPFDVFLKDFCEETCERHKQVQSDKPWDACNLLPQKPQIVGDKLLKEISMELTEVLSGVKPTVVSGVAGRRSDHIDDILFAEWRRCEPEWTSLHTDEATVKNQIFESIFQRILTETIDEYKKTVMCDSKPDHNT